MNFNYKKIKISFLILIFLSALFYTLFRPGGFLSSTEMGHLISLLINLNSIKIKTDNHIDKDKIKIYWSAINEEKRLILEGKRNVGKILLRYGSNTFSIYYDDRHIAEISQAKYGNWHYHTYTFSFKKNNDAIKVDLEITGTDKSIYILDLDWGKKLQEKMQ